MKKNFCVCCIAALCAALAGCAGNSQSKQPPEVPVQAVQIEPTGAEIAVLPPSEEPIPISPAVPEDENATDTDQFVGTWQAVDAPEYRICISRGSGSGYIVDINWDRNEQETIVWQLAGPYDEIWEGIDYLGAKFVETAGKDGSVVRTPVPEREEITGLIYFEDDGTLHWYDEFDHTGDKISFERA